MKGLIECQIDGSPVAIEDVGVFRQRDSYPGGHAYRLLLRGTQLRRAFRGQANGRLEAPIDDRTASSILFAANALLTRLKGSRGTERHVLNTVGAAEFTDESVAIEGLCSAIIDADFALFIPS